MGLAPNLPADFPANEHAVRCLSQFFNTLLGTLPSFAGWAGPRSGQAQCGRLVAMHFGHAMMPGSARTVHLSGRSADYLVPAHSACHGPHGPSILEVVPQCAKPSCGDYSWDFQPWDR